MKITIFRNIFELETPYHVDVNVILDRIKSDHLKQTVKAIRSEKNKKQRNELKKKLPSILFSGTFSHRKKDAMPMDHSGLIVLDIDDIKDLSKTREILTSDKYTFACFLSPSGNGFKILVKIPPDIKRHKNYFLAIEKYFNESYKIQIDASGKNIGRVCYESFDPEIYVNQQSEVFKEYFQDIPETKPVNLEMPAIKASEDVTIEKVTKWWENNYDFFSGRNYAIYQLAAALNRFGVDYNAALSHCLQFTDDSKPNDPFDQKEINRVVNNVYENLQNSHGTEYFEDVDRKKSVVDIVMANAVDDAVDQLQSMPEFEDYTPIEIEQQIEHVKQDIKKNKKTTDRVFWYYDDGKLKIDAEGLHRFVNDSGYYIYYPNAQPDNRFFIQIKNNIVKKVDTRHIKATINEFILKHKQNAVYNILNERQKFFSEGFLNAIPTIKPHFLRDSANTAYIPTPEFLYKVTKKGVEKINYVNLTEGYIWESQITDRNFEYIKGVKDFDFLKFMENVASKPKLESLKSIIGYLIHTYKDPANSRAVFLYDQNITQFEGDPEGGSGKSLLIEGLKHIREVQPLPGDRIDFNKSFVFQELSESTQLAWVDELKQSFDFSQFFSRITNGLPIEKKRKDVIFISNEQAPKFAFTSNYKPKGSSGSHKRRRVDFGVSNHYNFNHSPLNEFEKRFFQGWDDNDWNKFFSVYIDCLVLFLNKGIIICQDDTEDFLTAISETSKEFVEYHIGMKNLEQAQKLGWIQTRKMYMDYLETMDIDSNNFSLQKYYYCMKKVLSLYKFKYKFEGKGETKILKFLDS